MTILDVGSNMGYMSYAAWLRGCDVDSIDQDLQWVNDNTYLRDMYRADYNIIRGHAPEHPSLRDRYDAVLMLSVIHHLMKKSPSRVTDFLRPFAKITDVVMMDFGGKGKFTDADLMRVITDTTPFKNVFPTSLGCRVNQRRLYVLFTDNYKNQYPHRPLCAFTGTSHA